jgi:hypothetical protein
MNSVPFPKDLATRNMNAIYNFDQLKVHTHDIFCNFFVLNQNLIGPEALFEVNLTEISIVKVFAMTERMQKMFVDESKQVCAKMVHFGPIILVPNSFQLFC